MLFLDNVTVPILSLDNVFACKHKYPFNIHPKVAPLIEFLQRPHAVTSSEFHQPQTPKESNFNQPISSQILQRPLIGSKKHKHGK